MKKLVINDGDGSFGLSRKAYEYMRLDYSQVEDYWESLAPGITKIRDMPGRVFADDRSNPLLVKCVEELGEEASLDCNLVVVKVDETRPYVVLFDTSGWERIIYSDEE